MKTEIKTTILAVIFILISVPAFADCFGWTACIIEENPGYHLTEIGEHCDLQVENPDHMPTTSFRNDFICLTKNKQ